MVIGFLESAIRDHYHRQLLFTLAQALARLDSTLDWESRTQLNHVLMNLQRMWCES